MRTKARENPSQFLRISLHGCWHRAGAIRLEGSNDPHKKEVRKGQLRPNRIFRVGTEKYVLRAACSSYVKSSGRNKHNPHKLKMPITPPETLVWVDARQGP